MNNGFIRWLLDIDRIPQGAEGVHLAWERGIPAWVWVGILFGATFFAMWSYWRIAGNRNGRGVLAGVRTAIILLVLVIICGPMLQLPRENRQEDWVLVLADRSESMRIQDAARSGAAGESAGRISRDEQLLEILTSSAPTWESLDREREILWLGFHDGIFELEEAAANPDESPADGGLAIDLDEPAGTRTQINTSLNQALQRAAARPVSGLVLLSDGRTPDPPTRALVRRLQ